MLYLGAVLAPGCLDGRRGYCTAALLPTPAAAQCSIPPLPTRMHGAQAAGAGGYGRWVTLQYIQTSRWNFCNMSLKMKHLKHMSETLAKTPKNTWKAMIKYMQHSDKKHLQTYVWNIGLVRLAGCQPANSAFLSHHFSTSHQPPASQQYFSLTANQHRSPATSQPNEAIHNIQIKTLATYV
jgi:hypothetical protein